MAACIEAYETNEQNIIIDNETDLSFSDYNEEDEKELQLQVMTDEIKKLMASASRKDDYDTILRKFNIKMVKNKKIVSPLREKIPMKKRIIQFKLHEPEDIFDMDCFLKMVK